MITIPAVIAAVQDGDPNKPAAVIAQAWGGRHEALSSVKIWDGVRHYEGKSLQSAFNLYLAEKQAGQPAAPIEEAQAVLGALPQEEPAAQP